MTWPEVARYGIDAVQLVALAYLSGRVRLNTTELKQVRERTHTRRKADLENDETPG